MGPEGPPGPPGVTPGHGLVDFLDDGQFMPPAGVTSVFVQAWGAGGGGSGADGTLVNGSGGGAGGFAWCVLPVQPGTPVPVDIGAGGTGGAQLTNGQPGSLSTVNNGLGGLAIANGGAGGLFSSSGGMGGTASCSGQGTARQGADGARGGTTVPPGQGGRPAVDGVIQPAPSTAGIGGTGGTVSFMDPGVGQTGGPGYVVIWW
ncbi:glycine-rich domain-containing protein [Actinacidiphila glaucinigra]|uniref:Glycine-rich domain-containing protein n=1 Tax=Actinacidiphila glaucinigra TaxID=235986 RepID=A0A239IRG6_9ACTN|nr:hypothetical protein [Actinacidiphila glaucinigra]SNS95992.1 hypothetical protein SAMN05216252_11180 [Actinacidiphila glaucinigra]